MAVIGAGMAGLTTAKVLKENGFDVTTFERARGPGGRMATRREGAIHYDKGAQYFTVKDERFEVLVKDLIEKGIVSEWNLRIGVYQDGNIYRKGSSVKRYVGTPGMSSITRYLSNGLDIRFDSEITSIKRIENQWLLKDNNGKQFGPFRVLVFTAPPPQSWEMIDTFSSSFGVVGSIEPGPCWTVIVGFPSPLDISYDGIYFNGHPLAWASRDSSKPGRPKGDVWVLHGSYDWSSRNLDKKPGKIEKELIRSFLKAVDRPDKPEITFSQRWKYSRFPKKLSIGCLLDEEKMLGIAGDWLYGSGIEGAYLSGLELAGKILDQPKE